MNIYNNGNVTLTAGDIERMQQRIAELERENAELVAQVELIKDGVNAVRSASGPFGFGLGCTDTHKSSRKAWMKLNNATESTPTQCLNQIKAEAFGDGYYEGFIDGAKHQDEVDLNTKSTDGIARIKDEAMRCSEIAENDYAERVAKGE